MDHLECRNLQLVDHFKCRVTGTKGALLTGCVLIAVLQGGAAVKVKFRANDDQEQLMNFQSWKAYTNFMRQLCCGRIESDQAISHADMVKQLPPKENWTSNPLQAAMKNRIVGDTKAAGPPV